MVEGTPHQAAAAGAWLELRAAAADVEQVGRKAHALARAALGGAPVAPGWVLPVEAAAALLTGADVTRSSGPDTGSSAQARARELLALAPGVDRWILRSSSPAEDREGASAAGLLRSEVAAAVPESVAAALVTVAGSGAVAEVRAALRAAEGVPVAVLAQPLLALSAWWTVEIHPADGVALLDGWRLVHGEALPAVARLPWPCSGADAARVAASPRVWMLARAVLEASGPGAWQLEVGEQSGAPVLLQLRPAPARWAALPEADGGDVERAALAASGPAGESAGGDAPGSPVRGDLPRFPLHDGDAGDRWRWDAEHCPTPLCPLLAGWFARWLAARPARHPSRLIQGRWHDRASAAPGPAGAPPAPTSPAAPPWPAPAPVAAAVDAWERQELPRLRAELDALAHLAVQVPSAPHRWPEFMAGWLDFQTAYFDAPASARARAWAHQVVAALGRCRPPVPHPPLPPTESAARERELADLARRIAAALPDPAEGSSAHRLERALARATGARLRACAHELEAHRRRYGYVAVAPWDGRGVCLDEDPWPLLHELAHRIATGSLDSGPGARVADRARAGQPAGASRAAAETGYAARLARAFPDAFERSRVQEAAQLAARVLALAEDDDAWLARAYALFRRAARGVARALAAAPLAEREVFELLPADLEAHLEQIDPVRWRRGVQRGRALAALWEAHPPLADATAPATGAVGVPGDQRRGLAAAPGRAIGPVRRLEAAQQEGGPLRGEVLVVRTLLPHDAVVLGRIAAVVVEAGTPLGHAAVLAREHGVPAVVAVPGALRWLAAAERALVDGDRGTVTILGQASPGVPGG